MRTVIFIFILHIPLDESTIPGYQKNSNFRFNIWIPGMFQHYPEFKKIGSKNLCPSDRLGEQRAHSGQASQRVLADWGAGQVSTSCPAWPSLLHSLQSWLQCQSPAACVWLTTGSYTNTPTLALSFLALLILEGEEKESKDGCKRLSCWEKFLSWTELCLLKLLWWSSRLPQQECIYKQHLENAHQGSTRWGGWALI